MPLCGTRPFMEKMREELCEVDAKGQLSLKPGVEWPAFLRYNTTQVLDPHGVPTEDLDLFTCLTQPPEVILKVDPAQSASVVAAREREAREATAGPDWGYFPRTPDLKKRPELRKDLKMLTHRAHWDPQQRYKSLGWERKGTNVKSAQRVSYPKFLNEGYVTLDTTYPRDNLPPALRFKSLTEQVLADERIRKRLHERFRRKQERAGGWRPRKGQQPLSHPADLPAPGEAKSKKPPLKVRKDSSLAQVLDNHELARARQLMQLGYEDPEEEPDTLSRRVLPIMPWQGGTGKLPTKLEIHQEDRRRAGKRVRPPRKRKRNRDPDRAVKKRVMGKR